MSISSGGAGNMSNASSRFTTPQSRTSASSRTIQNGPPQPPTTTMTTATSHKPRDGHQQRSASISSSAIMAQQAQQLCATPIKAQHYQPPAYGRVENCKHVTFGKNGGTSRRGFTLGTKSYAEIRHECLDKGVLWQDPDFPALDESVFFTAQPPKPFEWQRPHEIVAAPKFFVDGASRFDVSQGELGDCWFLAAVANLVTYRELFTHVVPDDQSFEPGEYCGAFRFIFWRFGEWVEVMVDDRLPTFHNRLLFMHSTEQSEFWSALLEKAYAKLHGSYEQLKGGSTSEAMEDFTGGLTEYYSLKKAPENLYKIMQKAIERKSLMGCSIDVADPTMIDFKLPNGLMAGHAYSITAVKAVTLHTSRVSGRISLLRLRNPWGNQCEWKGAWSDKSSEWRSISEGDRQKLDITFEDDGEFWMSFEDFIGSFSKLEICNLGAESLEREYQYQHHHHPQTYGGSHGSGSSGSVVTPIMRRVRWETQIFEGSWTRGVTAGGCRNYLNTFPHNPQYEIRLTEPDDEDEEEQLCTCVVALLQKSRPRAGGASVVTKESVKLMNNTGSGEIAEAGKQNEALLDYNTIGFAIYYLKNPDNTPRPLPLDYFRYNTSIARSPTFINLREVTARFRLPPGTYCIIPSTFESNLEGDFLLRVFSEKAYPMHEYDDKVGLNDRIPQAVPANVRDSEFNAELKQAFTMLAGNTKEITYKQLQMILNSVVKKLIDFKFNGFSTEACRSMVAMLDRDCTGRLGFDEFLALWVNIRLWKSAFAKFDRNRSGTLDAYELRALLHHVGYTINWRTLRFIVLRFASSGGDDSGASRGDGESEVVPGANSNTAEVTISFEDFILAATKLKTIIDHFRQHCESTTHHPTSALGASGATAPAPQCTFSLIYAPLLLNARNFLCCTAKLSFYWCDPVLFHPI